MVRSMNMIELYYRTVNHKYLIYKMSHHAKLWDHRRLNKVFQLNNVGNQFFQ